ncbi:MAG TPA: chemotaxis protein CheB [Anaeromyxobacter sp.]|nr:chemotaxis protein CheB [Anaeromyxobacter sp.]
MKAKSSSKGGGGRAGSRRAKAKGKALKGRAPQSAGAAEPEPAGREERERPEAVEAAPESQGETPPGDAQPQPAAEVFPIVGIGSSAGGLEALEQFLRNVPERSGIAFVVVQHLDPGDRGAFVDLLNRSSPLPVEQAADQTVVKPDHVYVIPPAKDMSVLHGILHLMPQGSPRGLNLPVDFFFRSLAEDRQERAIAVVLSGMGTDGTLGLRAIKEKGGATFVQALTSAKFDGMPRSALDAGLADVVASAAELPARILAYHQHAAYAAGSDLSQEEKQQGALAKVFILLRTHTGNDFSLYKRSTVYRRVERRMGLHQIDRIANYVRVLRENPKEVDLLFKELLIGVTSFFRDPSAWEHLKTHVLPEVFAARGQGGTIRAWVPGCSTGEEAYSLAIVLKEAMEERKELPSTSMQIFATDLDTEAIEKARVGTYPANIAADVSPERLRRFFVQDERGYRVSKEIREAVVFAPQNVIMDPPFTKLDLLSCRNLLIYLSPEVQKKLIPVFHYALNPGGVLFLGSAETVGAFGAMFAPMDGKTRLYRRLEDVAGQTPIDFFSSYRVPTSPEPGEPRLERPVRENIQTMADRVIVQRFAPTAILANDRGDVLYTSGRTGKYLEPAVGRANLNLFAMAREGLRYELSAAFNAALKEDRPVIVRGVKVGTNGGTQTLDLTVQRLVAPPGLRGTMMIVLTDVSAPPPAEQAGRRQSSLRMEAVLGELQRAREELQSTREEMQTSQEELKSMNEELQSTNEELQSTNEELTTSKEEMQSMNEELQTVNHELQSKVDELSRSNNDMKNLLNSTDIATLFLDGELLVRRFTTQTSKLIKLIPGDTGRPITDIASELKYPDLAEDAREVLRTLIFKERQVSTRDGRWFSVRILPYRTVDNVIDGVVITFSDVTATTSMEERLRARADDLKEMADSLPVIVWGSRPDGACDYLSRRWTDFTGAAESEHLGYGWLEQVHPEDRERVRESWRAAIRSGAVLDIKLRLRGQDGSYHWFMTRAVPIRNEQGATIRWYGTHTDLDDLRGGPVLTGGEDTASAIPVTRAGTT